MNKFIKQSREKYLNKAAPELSDVSRGETYNFTLRMKYSLSHEIDAAIEDLDGMSKSAFILMAIRKELKRMKNE